MIVVLMQGGHYCSPCYRAFYCAADVLREIPDGICGHCGSVVEDGKLTGEKVNQ